MRKATAIASNPFALMMSPELVLQTMERSDELRKLAQRQFHPLDDPGKPSADADLAAFDAAVDRAHIQLPAESADGVQDHPTSRLN